ncbi:MAG: hypothetical protein PHQ85_06280 [Eubacteriales bacterium]|jgi:exopolyphosphatase/guanosine-5'-triphosphate,3'-diphosphate pyrophosphatase|nr:hypothetical protein [Eubacteriales bacterium]MDD4105840.1 hypothetical protein [Eubacteriales bacterium]MDD4710886.1 hypothetical protein [Eubacteriales bacterium]NLO15667.1 hypothetical protein [Clostridiales bacterium]
MSRRAAVIIIGSNSTRMLAADLDSQLSNPVRGREETRLFSGLDASFTLSIDAMTRTAQAAARLNLAAQAAGAREICLAATSAARDAGNTNVFAKLLRDATGLSLRILSGDEEAELSFLGAAAIPPQEGMIGVMDIGGGSTELVTGTAQGVLSSCSLQVGATRLHMMQAVDSLQDLGKARALVRDAIAALPRLRADHWVLVGGTGTTLMHILLKIPYGTLLPEDLFFRHGEAEEQLHHMAALPPGERKNIVGLPESRVDIMPTGLCILLELMAHLNICGISVTQRNNTDGFLYRLTRKKGVKKDLQA